ncbi:hypothetical protein Pogu_1038 [Pyrobaculum oguniense TE7]|uniref:Divalent heavy-metal cations transporter n=1 Tax=Pyrobaculum oguniense (strain DSM 13380 / JCM 10595 / TE7) TaxID=698757 RepID=H6Q8I3_PYROT|nr:hypothetical protein Pogu_1038 [Pyrobaculum oguniense TE7]
MGLLFILAFRDRLSETKVAFLQAVAGGILAYLAMGMGHSAVEYVEELAKWETAGEFLIATVVTTAGMIVNLAVLSCVEQNISTLRGLRHSLLVATVIAVAFGVHGVGEGFPIAAALMGGYVAQAYLFAIGFAVHNFKEGFRKAGPVIADRRLKPRLSTLTLLSLQAGSSRSCGVLRRCEQRAFHINSKHLSNGVYCQCDAPRKSLRHGYARRCEKLSLLVCNHRRRRRCVLTKSIILFSDVH